MEKTLNLIKNDPWLEPYSAAIEGRHQFVLDKMAELTKNGKQTLSDFASGYLFFGLHRTKTGWTFREWAPNATRIYGGHVQQLGGKTGLQTEEAQKRCVGNQLAGRCHSSWRFI